MINNTLLRLTLVLSACSTSAIESGCAFAQPVVETNKAFLTQSSDEVTNVRSVSGTGLMLPRNLSSPNRRQKAIEPNVQISSSLVTTDTSFTSVQPYKRKLGRQRGQGIASWYGPGFHGRRTANGERFNRYALTAAHKTLPLGTRLSVFNPRTGKQIVVRINDRGPYIGRRVLDLSEAAATALGFKSRGRDWVIFTALKPTENAPPVQGPGAAAEITETTQTAMTVTAHPSEPISAVSDYNDDEGEGEMLSTSVFLSDPPPTSRR